MIEYSAGKCFRGVSKKRKESPSMEHWGTFKGKLLVFMSWSLILFAAMVNTHCSSAGQSGPKFQDPANPSHDAQTSPLEDYAIGWFKAGSPDRIKGVALVVHGLNLRPLKMGSIIELLTDSGIDVLNLSLRGHGQNYSHKKDVDTREARMEAFKTVSYQLWMDETYGAYGQARKRSDEKKVPLFLVGFSLGGLIGADLLASYPDVRFDRMILLAPALDIHGIHYAAKLLSPFPRLVIPSMTSKSYLANNGTPVAGYNALFETMTHFNQHAGPKLNVPTIIFIDPEDELVSYRKLKRRIEKEPLDQWRFLLVEKGKAGLKEKMHHLVIDEPSVGTDTWSQMKKLMIEHLSP